MIAQARATRPDIVDPALAAHPSLTRLTAYRAGPAEATGAAEQGLVAESVHALLAELGAATPTLVVVEDVHWADHSSRDLLTLLLTRGFPSEVSLLVTYRSDDLHRRHPSTTPSPCGPGSPMSTTPGWLRSPSATSVVSSPPCPHRNRRGGDGRYRPAGRGQPFFAEELASSAVSGRAATGGLARVLQARIEQLDETALQVVRALAVAERDVSHDMLAEVVDLTESELDAAGGRRRGTPRRGDLLATGLTGCGTRCSWVVLDQLLPGGGSASTAGMPPCSPSTHSSPRPPSWPGMRWRAETVGQRSLRAAKPPNRPWRSAARRMPWRTSSAPSTCSARTTRPATR